MESDTGTGKTMLARAVAAQTKSTFLKLAGPQLVQMFIGDGAKLVRDAFALAKEKAPAIIFIDELDAIGFIFCNIQPFLIHANNFRYKTIQFRKGWGPRSTAYHVRIAESTGWISAKR